MPILLPVDHIRLLFFIKKKSSILHVSLFFSLIYQSDSKFICEGDGPFHITYFKYIISLLLNYILKTGINPFGIGWYLVSGFLSQFLYNPIWFLHDMLFCFFIQIKIFVLVLLLFFLIYCLTFAWPFSLKYFWCYQGYNSVGRRLFTEASLTTWLHYVICNRACPMLH